MLTGSPITDVKITLINGKAHQKHTEGGDFREATYRGIRQGLMQAESILLEPYYEFLLEIPTGALGRAMTDIDRMGGKIFSHEASEELALVKGIAPVRNLWDYQKEVTIYTKGEGTISFRMYGYEPCAEQEKIVTEISYAPEADLKNTPDSVFCDHGAGFLVKWYDVKDYMHIDTLKEKEMPKPQNFEIERRQASDEELMRIFEMTYGKVNIKLHKALKTQKNPVSQKSSKKPKKYDKNYLLVDGYNIIFADSELKKISEDNLDLARSLLIDKLCNYKTVRDCEIIIVFDAYRVKGNFREVEEKNGVSIVYTKEAETADSYIEKTSKELLKNNKVQVATSDALEQIIIMSSGGIRISAPQLIADIKASEREIKDLIEKINRENI